MKKCFRLKIAYPVGTKRPSSARMTMPISAMSAISMCMRTIN